MLYIICQLSLETAVATDIAVATENATTTEITVTEAPTLQLPTEEPGTRLEDIERLENEESHRIRKQKSKKCIIDKKIILKSNVIKKWEQNTRIYCVYVHIFKLFKKT